MKIALYTALSVDECVRRITEAVDPMTLWSRMGMAYFKPMMGEIHGSQLTLLRRGPMRNSWAPTLRGTLAPHESGTVLTATLDISPHVRPFMEMWLFFVAVIGGLAVLVIITNVLAGEAGAGTFCWIAVPVAMLLIGLALQSAGEQDALEDESYIVDSLRDLLEATAVETDAATSSGHASIRKG